MNWIKHSEQEPTTKDLPFIAYNHEIDYFELFDDADWFGELSEKDRLEYKYWMRLFKPRDIDTAYEDGKRASEKY